MSVKKFTYFSTALMPLQTTLSFISLLIFERITQALSSQIISKVQIYYTKAWKGLNETTSIFSISSCSNATFCSVISCKSFRQLNKAKCEIHKFNLFQNFLESSKGQTCFSYLSSSISFSYCSFSRLIVFSSLAILLFVHAI